MCLRTNGWIGYHTSVVLLVLAFQIILSVDYPSPIVDDDDQDGDLLNS